MNRGCVSAGQLECDSCQRTIEPGARYLLTEDDEDKKARFCVECSLNKGYAAYVKEKGEEVLTFFPSRLENSTL